MYTRSPKALVKEIILSDDASTFPELGQQLENYVKTIPMNIRIIRSTKRIGLTRTKLMGAQAAVVNT